MGSCFSVVNNELMEEKRMIEDVRNLLPIGSVVLLEEATKKVMIYGVKQTDIDTEIEYDYLGVVYPEGYLGEGSAFFFDHDQISRVFHKGYSDQEREIFVNKLHDFYAEDYDKEQ